MRRLQPRNLMFISLPSEVCLLDTVKKTSVEQVRLIEVFERQAAGQEIGAEQMIPRMRARMSVWHFASLGAGAAICPKCGW